MTRKAANVGPQVMRYIEKEVMLRTLDQHWREHLAAMDYMRQGIFLRSYAQKNPKQEYKREAFELFSAMLDRIKLRHRHHGVEDPGAQPGGNRARGARAPAAPRARAAGCSTPKPSRPIQAAPSAESAGCRTRTPGPAAARSASRAIAAVGLPATVPAAAAPFVRARAEGGPQRALPLRLGQEIQALPRRAAAGERLTRAARRLNPLHRGRSVSRGAIDGAAC